MTIQHEQWATLQATAQLMHSVLAVYPQASTIEHFKAAQLELTWPRLTHSEQETLALAKLTDYLANWQDQPEQLVQLQLDFGQLFFGPGTPKAPPWGSVYRSATQLLNDHSTLQVKAFFAKHQIIIEQNSNEPEDHIATFMAVIAYLFNKMSQQIEYKEILIELLQEQLLPWGYRCLSLAQQHATTDYYLALSLLCEEYLQHLQAIFDLKIKPITLYH